MEGGLGDIDGGESPLDIGLGLEGRPGLSRGADNNELTVAPGAASMPAKDPALESGGDLKSVGGAIGTVCREFWTIVSFGSKLPSFGVFGVLDFDFFLDKLLISASFAAATSRSLSSSSRVLRRPRSLNIGISSTSKISS